MTETSPAAARQPADVVVDSWTRYLNEIGRIPLLRHDEVCELARAIEVGVLARERLAGPSSEGGAPRPQALPPDLVAELGVLVVEGEQARRRLVAANLRLVVSVAKRCQGRGVPLPDLVQEGAFGLLRAVEKFDHRRGFAFSTYATWWIKQAVNRAVAEQSRPVRVPVSVHGEVVAAARVREQVGERATLAATASDIARIAGVDVDRAAVLLRASAPVVTLPVDGGEHADDVLAVQPDHDQVVIADTVRERLDVALRRLPEAHRQVLAARVGWDGGPARSQRVVADDFGVSRDVIRRIEAEARMLLRAMPQVADLAGWFDG